MTKRFKLFHGDSLDILKTLPDNSFDSVVTDPPYGLSDHSPKDVENCLSAWLRGEEYKHKGKGYMGHSWDAWVPGPEVWREVLRVLKPGGHAMVFAGSRTQDLMGISLRLAGFQIRDTLMWVYAQGFPKNADASKAIDKKLGCPRKVIGVKPGHEEFAGRSTNGHMGFRNDSVSGFHRPWMDDKDKCEAFHMQTAPGSPEAAEWEGWGTALKPSYEPIILCRKPLEGTLAENLMKWGVGAINIDKSRIPLNGDYKAKSNGRPSQTGLGDNYDPQKANQPDTVGRWPGNFLHDGSGEVLALFPESSARGKRGPGQEPGNSSSSAERFFFCTKTTKKDRHEGMGDDGNKHSTVKPTALMRYMTCMVTPPGGKTLDLFMGSGSTGKGAMLDDFEFVGIEGDEVSYNTAEIRIGYASDTRLAELSASVKATA